MYCTQVQHSHGVQRETYATVPWQTTVVQLVIDTGGVDLSGLAIVYMRTNAYLPREVPYPRLIQNLVFVLERATRTEGIRAAYAKYRPFKVNTLRGCEQLLFTNSLKAVFSHKWAALPQRFVRGLTAVGSTSQTHRRGG